MNKDILIFVKNRLKEEGYFDNDMEDNLIGEYVLELFETFIDQSHDKHTLDIVPRLFFLFWTEFKNQE